MAKHSRQLFPADSNFALPQRLPAYAPDLNPAEGVWANLKSTELANRCEASIEVTQLVAEDGMKRIRSSQQLLFSFLGQTGLSF